jgi:hypothetical protein
MDSLKDFVLQVAEEAGGNSRNIVVAGATNKR